MNIFMAVLYEPAIPDHFDYISSLRLRITREASSKSSIWPYLFFIQNGIAARDVFIITDIYILLNVIPTGTFIIYQFAFEKYAQNRRSTLILHKINHRIIMNLC